MELEPVLSLSAWGFVPCLTLLVQRMGEEKIPDETLLPSLLQQI